MYTIGPFFERSLQFYNKAMYGGSAGTASAVVATEAETQFGLETFMLSQHILGLLNEHRAAVQAAHGDAARLRLLESQ